MKHNAIQPLAVFLAMGVLVVCLPGLKKLTALQPYRKNAKPQLINVIDVSCNQTSDGDLPSSDNCVGDFYLQTKNQGDVYLEPTEDVQGIYKNTKSGRYQANLYSNKDGVQYMIAGSLTWAPVQKPVMKGPAPGQ